MKWDGLVVVFSWWFLYGFEGLNQWFGLVAWVGGLGFQGLTVSNNPFHKGILGIQITHLIGMILQVLNNPFASTATPRSFVQFKRASQISKPPGPKPPFFTIGWGTHRIHHMMKPPWKGDYLTIWNLKKGSSGDLGGWAEIKRRYWRFPNYPDVLLAKFHLGVANYTLDIQSHFLRRCDCTPKHILNTFKARIWIPSWGGLLGVVPNLKIWIFLLFFWGLCVCQTVYPP